MATVGDFVQVRTYIRLYDQIAMNRYFYKITAIHLPGATAQHVADAWSIWFKQFYPSLMPQLATYLGIQAQTMAPVPGLAATSNAGVSAGSVVDKPLPRQTCGLITWRDGNPTHQGRGRTYWPFPVVTMLGEDGKPTPGYVGSLATIKDMLLAVTIADAALVPIYSCLLHLRHPGRVPEYTQVTSGNASTLWGTQRKRGDQGQPNRPPSGL